MRAVLTATFLWLGSGCTVLFPSSFAERAVVARGPIYDGMIVTAMLQSRDGDLAAVAAEDLRFEWVAHPGWDPPAVGRLRASDDNVAFELALPEDVPMEAGEQARLEVLVGGESYGELEVEGLPTAALSGSLTVADVAPLYSMVTLSNVTFDVDGPNTNRPVRIRATRLIQIEGTISAAASGTEHGPGACAEEVECPGWPAGDALGAGAGHEEAGDESADEDGLGGPAYGQPSMVDLSLEGGSPGGGAAPGAGGGVIELTSLMRFEALSNNVEEDLISVRGGNGGDDESGGGSGGGVLVRFRDRKNAIGVPLGGGDPFGANGRARFDVIVEFGIDSDQVGSSAKYYGPMVRGLEIEDGVPSPLIQAPGVSTVELPVFAEATDVETADFTAVVFDSAGSRPADVRKDSESEDENHFVVGFEPAAGEIHRVCLLPSGASEADPDDLFTERHNCFDVAVP